MARLFAYVGSWFYVPEVELHHKMIMLLVFFFATSIKPGNKILQFGKEQSNNGCRIELKKPLKPFKTMNFVICRETFSLNSDL